MHFDRIFDAFWVHFGWMLGSFSKKRPWRADGAAFDIHINIYIYIYIYVCYVLLCYAMLCYAMLCYVV